MAMYICVQNCTGSLIVSFYELSNILVKTIHNLNQDNINYNQNAVQTVKCVWYVLKIIN